MRSAEPLTDLRDGQMYQTVQIGDQIWMAENLNYGEPVKDCEQSDNDIPEKTFYHNDPELNPAFGALYTWNEAMGWTKKEGAQGLCPPGWHVPTLAEWEKLGSVLGVDSSGQKLKASKNDSIPWDGNNVSGFTAIPSGVGYGKYFGRKGHWAVYWTSTESDRGFAWFAQLDGYWYPQPPKYIKLFLGDYYIKENAFCIRCIQDKPGNQHK